MNHSTLAAIGRELSKDKWLVFLLVLILLVAFIRTSNAALEQLLVTAVGGFLGLVRTSQSQSTNTNIDASSARIEVPPPK